MYVGRANAAHSPQPTDPSAVATRTTMVSRTENEPCAAVCADTNGSRTRRSSTSRTR